LSPHASNADRIARAAAEAEAAMKEKAERKAKRETAAAKVRSARPPKAPPRIKIVWAVGQPGLEPVKVFPYKERAEADAEAERRGKGCRVAPLKVPME
jgi:hypothetical protein